VSVADRNPVLNAELQTFAHATEDIEKVEKALANILGDEIRNATITHSELKGHFKDPITIIKAKVKKKKPASR